MDAVAEAPWMGSRRVPDGCYFHGGVDFKRKGFVCLGNSLQHGCCSRAPWIGSRHVYIGDYLGLHQRPSEVTREVVVPHQEPSTAWML